MKWYVKLILVALLCYLFLANYKLVDGLSLVESPHMSNEKIATDYLQNVRIEKIYYYKTITRTNEYSIIIKLSNARDIFTTGSTRDIEMFQLVGAGSAILGNSQLYPNKITPIPVWVYIIALFVIMIIPSEYRKIKNEIECESNNDLEQMERKAREQFENKDLTKIEKNYYKEKLREICNERKIRKENINIYLLYQTDNDLLTMKTTLSEKIRNEQISSKENRTNKKALSKTLKEIERRKIDKM